MKNINRSIMSVVLALAMVFTSVSGFSKSASQNVKAETPDVDLTGVTVESCTSSGVDRSNKCGFNGCNR